MSKLSVVLPAYNEELMVGKTCRVLAEVLTEAKIPFSAMPGVPEPLLQS